MPVATASALAATSALGTLGLADYLIANPIVIGALVAGVVTIVVASLTYVGVVRSINAAATRTREELTAAAARAASAQEFSRDEAARERQHAAHEAQTERLVQARKDAYSVLVDDFIATMAMFGRLGSIDLDDEPKFQEPLLKLGASVNKTWLLSNVETAVKARELYAQMNELFFSLMARASRLQGLKREVKAAARLRDYSGNERLRLAREHGDRFDTDEHTKRHAEDLLQQGSEASDIWFNSQREHRKLLGEYGVEVARSVAGLMNTLQDLMSAARVELGLTGDSDTLREQTEAMAQRANVALAELMKRVSANN